ncbi:MAG TPA: tripartite tricarboxylate transporter permease [bacterium]|nr:tripartite tricarboxylate transporter permease [bacterium]
MSPWVVLHAVFALPTLAALLAGTVVGIFIGALPGIGPAVGIGLLLPLSYFLRPAEALLFYVSLYQAAEYGGSITAIAVSTPGAPNSAATILDGYALNRAGAPGKAFGYSLWAAIFASYAGILGMFLLAQPASIVALALGSAEFAVLGVFALTMVGTLSASAPLEGLLSGLFGLLLSTVGTDLITNAHRYTFDQPGLFDGVPLLPVLVGVFALPQVVRLLSGPAPAPATGLGNRYRVWISRREFRAVLRPTVLGTVVGFVLGLLPGLSGSVPPWVSYNAAKSISRHPERFGTGTPEGIVAPEATNAAVMHSTLIPAFTLGVPGTPTSAVILGAMMIAGLQPGPLLMRQHADVVYELLTGLLISTAALWIMGLLTTQIWARTVSLPRHVLAASIFVLCMVGAYTARSNVFDVWMTLLFGAVGYFMDALGYSIPSLILGLILGGVIETNARQALIISHGSFGVFLSSPISASLLAASVLSILYALRIRRREQGRPPISPGDA